MPLCLSILQFVVYAQYCTVQPLVTEGVSCHASIARSHRCVQRSGSAGGVRAVSARAWRTYEYVAVVYYRVRQKAWLRASQCWLCTELGGQLAVCLCWQSLMSGQGGALVPASCLLESSQTGRAGFTG